MLEGGTYVHVHQYLAIFNIYGYESRSRGYCTPDARSHNRRASDFLAPLTCCTLIEKRFHKFPDNSEMIKFIL